MKIAHILWSFTVGGAEEMFIDIFNHSDKRIKYTLIIINAHYH